MDSFIGWIGGKKVLRKEILTRFPTETPTKYVEVCGGAGWVLFGKEKKKCQLEVFNDIDSNLINLYRCIQHHPEALVKELEYVIPAREVFNDFREQIDVRGLTDIQRAARYFLPYQNELRFKHIQLCHKPKTDRQGSHWY